MNRRDFLKVLGGTGAAVGLSHCGPPYAYLRIAQPSPLLGAHHISLEPMHFEGMRVGGLTEAEYLSRKTPEQQASFNADKQEFANRFLATCQARSPIQLVVGPPPDANTMILRPMVRFYEPGIFTYVVNINTQVDMAVHLVRPDGAVLEEIAMRTVVQASFFNISSGGRLRTAGANLGGYVGEYVRRRTQGIAFNHRGVVRV